jgi:hypothetical protein
MIQAMMMYFFLLANNFTPFSECEGSYCIRQETTARRNKRNQEGTRIK